MASTRKLIPLLNEMKSCYSRAHNVKLDFSEAPEVWKPRWAERSMWLERAESADREVRPMYREWKSRKDSCGPELRCQIERATDELVSTLKRLHLDSEMLHRAIAKERDETREKLGHLKKSNRAIASYATHA